MGKKKIIHYINQFYAQIGGEEMSGQTPLIKTVPVGPGVKLQELLGDEYEIIATIICGDNHFAENQEQALDEILNWVDEYKPDAVITGPAFNAGRYGLACGALGSIIKTTRNIPVVSAMYPENPGVELYKKDIYIIETGSSAVVMRTALPKVAKLAAKLLTGEDIGFPEEEGYIAQGYRVNVRLKQNGAERGVDMLLKKIKGEAFVTELPMPIFDNVDPADPIANIKQAKIALVTSGGIVPFGNPDRIESANASKYGKYSIEGVDDLTEGKFITVHGGYDPVYALEDPDRVLPLDAVRVLEKEGAIGNLFNYYYATVGNATSVASAKKYGDEIGKDLLENGVEGVILTST